MFNICDYQRNANQNYHKRPPHQSERPSLRSPQITTAGGGVEKREPSCTVGGNGSWYSHYGEQYGGTLENYTQNYHMTQQSHSWAYIQTKLSLKKTHTPVCSLQHFSQQPRYGNNPNVHQQMIGLARCLNIYNGILLSHKKNKIMPFSAMQMQLEILILGEVRQRKINALYHLYMESKIW